MSLSLVFVRLLVIFGISVRKKKKKVQLQRKNEPDDNKGGWKNVNNLSKKIFSDTNLLLQG